MLFKPGRLGVFGAHTAGLLTVLHMLIVLPTELFLLCLLLGLLVASALFMERLKSSQFNSSFLWKLCFFYFSLSICLLGIACCFLDVINFMLATYIFLLL